MKNTLLGWLLSSLLFGSTAMAADTWHIGMNNLYIQDYIANQSVTCASGLNCPQTQPVTLSTLGGILLDVIGNQHTGSFREVVDMSKVAPTCASQTCSDNANWAYIDSVLDKYWSYEAVLIITLGNPVPAWAASWAGNGGQCWGTTDATNWSTLRDNVAWAIGNYLDHYASLSGTNGLETRASWMVNRMIVETWNEFDSIQTSTTCGGGDRSYGTPARNASLTSRISDVIGYYQANGHITGVQAQAMASMVGVYSGYTNPSCNGYSDGNANFCQYVKDFYTAWGTGSWVPYPNIHAYVAGTQSQILSALEGYAAAAYSGAPTSVQSKLILGETGWQQVKNNCSAGGFAIADTERDGLYSAVAGDATLQAKLYMLTFWDGLQYPYPTYSSLGCGANWGIILPDGTYGNAATNLFTYNKTH